MEQNTVSKSQREQRPITTLVIEDLLARDKKGFKKYGKSLTTHDGRDSLWDLYEELLDACQYIRKAIEERSFPNEESGADEDECCTVKEMTMEWFR